jgi:nucleotide-binding universal stress UspA family protein
VNTIVAAIDNSAAARPVLSMATALGEILNASVEALHISDNEGETASAIAESLGVPCRTCPGDPLTRIVERAADANVTAVVVGARRRLNGRNIGHLARQVADAIEKPVLVVPPEAQSTGRLHRVIFAMAGTRAKARNLKIAFDLAAAADLEFVIVHVDDEDSLPSFSDQVAHETQAYADEFLARNLRGGPAARLELRVGVPADEIIALTVSLTADLLAVGWPHSRDAHRGATAREILDRSHIPVLLVSLSTED